jgi:hypothetical protein
LHHNNTPVRVYYCYIIVILYPKRYNYITQQLYYTL